MEYGPKLDVMLNEMYIGSRVAVNHSSPYIEGTVFAFLPGNDLVGIKTDDGEKLGYIADELISLDKQETKLMRANLIAAFDEIDEALCVHWHSNVPATLAPKSLWGTMRMSG